MDMNPSSQVFLQFNLHRMADSLVSLVDMAGEAILNIYQQPDLQIEIKENQSPLTQADLHANAILVDGLKKLWPFIPTLSEEGGDVLSKGGGPICFWAVDPLDGTKEFIKRNDEFTVNVALIFQGEPLIGVVFAPALDKLYVGYSNENLLRGGKAESGKLSVDFKKNAMKREAGKWVDIKVSNFCSTNPNRPVRVASSRSHPSPELSNWLQQFESYEAIEVGSSLKFCMLAEGLIDVYPRFGPTCIWDIAAGHAVVNGAGGRVVNKYGVSITYDYSKLTNEYFFALCGD